MTGGAPRALCFTAYADNLRATAFVEGLADTGWTMIPSRGRGPRSTPLELVLTFLPNCWLALRTRADVAVGCKPHLNVTVPLLLCKARGMATWLDVDDLDHGYRTGLGAWLVRLTQRPFPKRYDLVSYHNPRLRRHLVQHLGCDPERMLQIPQGVDGRRFEATRRPVAAIEGRRIAIHAAHLNLASDLDMVLRAWRLIVARQHDAMLIVVGGGPRLGRLRKQAAALGLGGTVVFTGEVRPSEVGAYLAVADVALMYASDRPVNRYRCSLKLREYFAAGLPVVSNDVGELAEFKAVTYQSDSTIEAFATTAIQVLDGNQDDRHLHARELARAEMDWPQIMKAAERAASTRLGLSTERQADEPTATRVGLPRGR